MDKQIFLCLGEDSTLKSVKKIFDDTFISYSTNVNNKGIILTTLDIPYNICFADDEKFYIGSTNFAHKKVATKQKNREIKYLPKAGEYVVHSTHGVGKCEGLVTIKTFGVDKEFFKLTYRDGDTLYVPYENADCLSLYLADSDHVNLNKLGGKEFATQKLKAVKSIEDMSKELLELYAKRSASKGFKYPEDDYILTEFENSFEFTETADQLHAIEDIKHDMIAGKVMDRLVCGDVGFGKTEVAMRAMFKTIEAGKQVAFLAPTTVLSLQHYMTTLKRTQNVGVNVEMLNRFRTAKEQKQIIGDLKNNKINVICGTHRLLSDDIQFADLGLLILDEEQRFGVKAKEHIKQLKNNVNVLTLSATPIPRTLSMALTSIRDISLINTPPVNRLPVKTYVIGYDEQIVLNAINDEIERGGQVLVIYNNIENIYKVATQLETALHNKKAKFDVAHGQMTENALENAVKRLYDGKTNVFVSTTLIENGVDLPKANTLIVLESDKLGLSQMYQLRGRVGRSTEQAYAYFTFAKNKTLTEDASNRLQAIAENTELGSGFKIAMRDLSIRGAGELLGKTQHGHLVKIGYDMYYKLLNDTLRKMKGEKVETEREIKLEIALTSKIPTDFVLDETERLKIIAKISNITSKESQRAVIGELASTYGKLPKEIYTLSNIAYIKALAQAQKIKQITLNKNKMSVVYYADVDLPTLLKKVNKFTHFKFENTALPTINLNTNYFSVQTAMNYIMEFLSEQ
ncbi:MAG: transcription-repair coupling factor, partial [Clostridia bacterium]|nr:transcription-repair coupling factor [Clostridia bacterium]